LVVFEALQNFGKATAFHAVLTHVNHLDSPGTWQSSTELNRARLFDLAVAYIEANQRRQNMPQMEACIVSKLVVGQVNNLQVGLAQLAQHEQPVCRDGGRLKVQLGDQRKLAPRHALEDRVATLIKDSVAVLYVF
jgi:hypothetical protein